MTKAEKATRAENIRELQAAYPHLKDPAKLQDALYKVAVKAARNAEMICACEGWVDQRDSLRDELRRIAKEHEVDLHAQVAGDPRGFVLKLTLPTGRSNSFGGEGWGIA